MHSLEEIQLAEHEEHYIVCNNGSYYKIGKLEGSVLSKIKSGMDILDIAQDHNITTENIDQLLEQLEKCGVIGKGVKEKNSILFYKIPIVSPDKFLEKVVKLIGKYKVFSRLVFTLLNIAIILGMVLLFKDLKEIFTIGVFNLHISQYFMIYGLFFITILIHELSHGLACKYFNCKVGKMGFMLIFFAPAMYCDISGVRMLKNKKGQILSSFAGIYTNIIVLSISSIIFALAPSRLTAAFIILNITTIITNIVPFIRLDGYWMLSFTLGISNLYSKSKKGVLKLFQKSSAAEKFIAVYGMVNYCFMAVMLYSGVIPIIKATVFAVKRFIDIL